MNRVWQHLPLALTLLGVGAVAIYAFWPRPVPVDLATVAEGPLTVTVDEDGKTRVRERYVVSAPLAGRMARIELEPGDPVEAGRTLVTKIRPVEPTLLDERSRAETEARVRAMAAAVQQAESRIGETREAHEAARHEYERVKSLRKSSAVSAAEFDAAEHEEGRSRQAVRSAEFALQVAKFELQQAQAALRFTQAENGAASQAVGEAFAIHSPVSGKVLRKFEESSLVVTPGLPLVEIGDPREMEVEIDVLSADAAVIRPGATVWLHQWGQELPLEARVRLVEPAGFTKISALGVEEQRVNVIADFVGPPAARERLGDAYRVEAKIVVWDSPRVLKIPAGCLFRSGREWGVYVADGGRAALRMVEIGHQSGDEAEVLKGLAVGDRVILHPSDKLADGTHIESRAAE